MHVVLSVRFAFRFEGGPLDGLQLHSDAAEDWQVCLAHMYWIMTDYGCLGAICAGLPLPSAAKQSGPCLDPNAWIDAPVGGYRVVRRDDGPSGLVIRCRFEPTASVNVDS